MTKTAKTAERTPVGAKRTPVGAKSYNHTLYLNLLLLAKSTDMLKSARVNQA